MRLELLPQNVGKACAVKHRALLRLVLFAQSRKEDVFRAVLGIEEVYVKSVSMSPHTALSLPKKGRRWNKLITYFTDLPAHTDAGIGKGRQGLER